MGQVSLPDQIRMALDRGRQGGKLLDVLDRLADGRGRLEEWATGSISWWYPDPGTCEVMHAYGRLQDADTALAALGADMRARGVKRFEWSGRPGWDRIAGRYA